MLRLASVPNLLTIARLLLAPFVFSAILSGRNTSALFLFAGAALTDGFDGWLARRLGQVTTAGAYLDPIADKLLLSGAYLSLAISGGMPWWLVAVIFGRDLFLLVSSAIALLFTEFRQFHPSVWGKVSTLVQITCAFVWMLRNAFILPQLDDIAEALVWLTALATLWSGLHYGWRGLRLARSH
jgi:cardiolipin synthase (CMP-forming)